MLHIQYTAKKESSYMYWPVSCCLWVNTAKSQVGVRVSGGSSSKTNLAMSKLMFTHSWSVVHTLLARSGHIHNQSWLNMTTAKWCTGGLTKSSDACHSKMAEWEHCNRCLLFQLQCECFKNVENTRSQSSAVGKPGATSCSFWRYSEPHQQIWMGLVLKWGTATPLY